MTDRTFSKPLALCVALLTLIALVLPLGGVAAANHGTRTLQVTPETDTNPAGTTHTLTATVSEPATTGSGPIEIDFEIESGPPTRVNCEGTEDQECTGGTPSDDGNTPTSPDMTCTIDVGESSCQVSFTSEQTGTNVVRAWIDHDKSNSTVEADRNEGQQAACSADEGVAATDPCVPLADEEPGDETERDDTDVVKKTWVAADAAILDCEPETATNPSTGTGSSERYVCAVTDEFGNPIEGAHVDGENLNGANDPDSSPGNPAPTSGNVPDYDHEHDPAEPASEGGGHFCITGEDGTCSDTIRAIDGESGTALICFFASAEAAETQPNFDPSSPDQGVGGDCDTESLDHDDDDMTDVVQKTWEDRRANGVDAEPETDTNNVGENHTITATVYDQFGTEFSESGTTVNFEFFAGSPGDTDGNSDTSTPDRTCTTNDNSTDSGSSCSITYTVTQEGTDTVCVYVGNAPSSDPNNRTCGGEGLNESEDDPSAPDAPATGSNQGVDVVEKHWVEPSAGLDCEPEQDTNPQRSSHTVTCTALNEQGQGEEGTRIHAEATGANDPDNSDSPESPDFECTTPADEPLTVNEDESETCSFTHGPGESTSESGTTTYRVWIDEDNDASTFDGDRGEGPNAGDPDNPSQNEEGAQGTIDPGDEPEPDNTDVVQKHWVPAPATLTMQPETDQAKVGTCNPYTITVRDADGQPAQGAIIDVEQRHERSGTSPSGDEPRVLFCTPTAQQGANPSSVDTSRGDLSSPHESPDDPGTLGGETTRPTDENGQVTVGIAVQPENGSDGSGNVLITAFYEENDNDDPDQGEPQDSSTKTWIASEARNIVCSPRQASNPTGTTHTVTCTVTDAEGRPAANESVVFSETGPGQFTSSTQDETDQNGRVTATTTSSEPGEQSITATMAADTGPNEPDDVDECDRAANDPQGAPAGNCSDTVTKTWVQDEVPPECSDGVDNDNDGATDYPDDPGCASATDNDESDSPFPNQEFGGEQGQPVTEGPCTGFTTGSVQQDPNGSGLVVVGTNGNDALQGSDADDLICALDGDDAVQGHGGNDTIHGGGGKDAIEAGLGDDEVFGDDDKDVILGDDGNDELNGGQGNDNMSGGAGEDVLRGQGGWDTLKGNADDDLMVGARGNDILQGGGGNDVGRAGAGDDVLKGYTGNDELRGGGGEDLIRGSAGRDRLFGNAGNDVINGGRGRDRCRGGRGRDILRNCP